MSASGTPPAGSAGTPLNIQRDYPHLLRRMPAMAYISEPGWNGAWLYVSPQIEAILGYTAQEWCADPTLWASRLHPDDRQRVLETESAASVDAGTASEDYRLRHRDGSIVWIRDEAELLPGPTGAPMWQGVLIDITDHKLLEGELERRAAQQAAVAKLGEHALEGASTSDLLEEAVQSAGALLDAELAVMVELVPEQDEFRVRAQHGISGDFTAVKILASPVSQPGYAMVVRAPVVVEDWETEERFLAPPRRFGLRSGVCVLIEGAHGTFGVLSVQSQRPRAYRADEIDFLQSLANVLADALERQATDDDIRHRALHDALTGLPNRVLLLDRIEQALARLARRRSVAAVLFIDFDHFKVINDSLGHDVGDELLAAVAPRLRQAVRASDTVARFGGDEFAILLDDVASEADAIEMAERIAALFTRPFVIAGGEHFMTASIGIAIARGGELAHDLIRDADAAMYRAKERGRARYEVFDEAMRGRALARLRVENDLRRALERDELHVVYQPVIDLRAGSMMGVEALVRWRHPERGLTSPAEFVPIAEENGLIEPIGRFVLERACRQAVQWHAAHPDRPPINMSVNISAVELARPGLADTVGRILQGTGLDPSCLCLEITETAMLREPEASLEALRALSALGVRLAVDDFGTGYSSLSYLPRLPLNALKLDRSFIDGLGVEPYDTAITEAVTALARALSLWVIGEGVEQAEQARALLEVGCELVQGFHFSPPVEAREISAMLRENRRWRLAPPLPR